MTAAPPPQSGPDPADPVPAKPPRLLDGYSPKPGIIDQLVDSDRGFRPDWSPLADRLNTLAPQTIEHRRAQAQQSLDDNGILLTGPSEVSQPHLWPLDPIPFQLGADTFASLSASLAQRARLLNALAADLLGPQRVLKEKLIPPALLFANPHYRRAYHDLPVMSGRYIHLYAADVTRGDGGDWWVQGDRTQAPSGLGFTLENRIAIARVHSEWFEAMHTRRHARFFQTLRQTLATLATNGAPNPRIVLLSEGPTGHRGFEDAYLARYLGYTLTVGQDLAVRRNQTVLKTLGGALPVDVILRRLNDDACDPVELFEKSTTGVAGLVESQRQGNLAIANMLGSQLVEAPGLSAFLAPLCKFFFKEDLKLPSVATWWCGHQTEREYVLENLQELYLYPAFQAGTAAIDPSRLTTREVDDLTRKIRAQPEQFIGQQRLRRGTTPAWTGERIAPWHWALRMFAAMRDDSYEVLPGGLIRLAQDDAKLDSAPSSAERTQDCWVASPASTDSLTLLPPSNGPITLKRSGAELPSRVADNLYWLGRSIETAEGYARLLRGLITRIELDNASGESPPANGWPDLLSMVGDDMPADTPAATRIKHAALDAPVPGNLRHAIRECVRLAQAARDRISEDAWRLVARMERYLLRAAVTHQPDTEDLSDLRALLNHLVLELVAFAGLMSESMTRTLGWRFLDLGRSMERARHTAALLRHAMKPEQDSGIALLETVLDICDSTMTYRSRYLADLRPVPVVDLLITDDINPRSIAFQLIKIKNHLDQLPRDIEAGTLEPDQRLALSLLDAVLLADPVDLAGAGTDRSAIQGLLSSVIDQLPAIDQALTARFLAHTDLPQQFFSITPSPTTGGGSS